MLGRVTHDHCDMPSRSHFATYVFARVYEVRAPFLFRTSAAMPKVKYLYWRRISNNGDREPQLFNPVDYFK